MCFHDQLCHGKGHPYRGLKLSNVENISESLSVYIMCFFFLLYSLKMFILIKYLLYQNILHVKF